MKKQYEVIVESKYLENNIFILEDVNTNGGNLLQGTAIGFRTKEGDYKKCQPTDFETNCKFIMKGFTSVLE